MHKCDNHQECSSKAINEAKNICQEYGLRFTDSRKEVFEKIIANHAPTKAYDILDELQKDNKNVKAPIVYRALDFLMENGLIHRLHSFNSYVKCSHPKKHNHCYFMICNKCNSIEECCSLNLSKDIEKIGKSKQFKIENVAIEIEGTCFECLEN